MLAKHGARARWRLVQVFPLSATDQGSLAVAASRAKNMERSLPNTRPVLVDSRLPVAALSILSCDRRSQTNFPSAALAIPASKRPDADSNLHGERKRRRSFFFDHIYCRSAACQRHALSSAKAPEDRPRRAI